MVFRECNIHTQFCGLENVFTSTCNSSVEKNPLEVHFKVHKCTWDYKVYFKATHSLCVSFPLSPGQQRWCHPVLLSALLSGQSQGLHACGEKSVHLLVLVRGRSHRWHFCIPSAFDRLLVFHIRIAIITSWMYIILLIAWPAI